MRQLITEFPNQMRDAWKVVENSPIDLEGFIPKGALILGMGGSGISGVIASRMLAATSPCSNPGQFRLFDSGLGGR